MAKLTKPISDHGPLNSHPTQDLSSTSTPRVSTNSNATTLYETASEGRPERKPHVSRNKLVRNDFGVWVPQPLETGKSEHGPWTPPQPIVEDDNCCCCAVM